MQGLKVSSVGASIAFTIAGLRQFHPGAQASGAALDKETRRPKYFAEIDELVRWEVAMQELANEGFRSRLLGDVGRSAQ